MSGPVGGGVGKVVLHAGAARAQALSCRAGFSPRLDNKVDGRVARVGPCRWGRG